MGESCPRCKASKYEKPSMKLLVNSCGHPLCDTCVETLWARRSTALPCPNCGAQLFRDGFRLQLFTNATVEKEINIRRRILKDFNLRPNDFSSLREYNDYLELIETIVFNMMNDIDINGTKQLVADFKERHSEKIGANRKRGETQGTWADGESFERIVHGASFGGFAADEAAPEPTGTAAAPRYEYVSQTPPVVGPPIPDDIDTSGLSLPPEALASGLDPTHVALRLLHSAFDGLYA